ncbi:interleukin-10 receptor subunit beta-like [Labrus mixtus]|uniref:interleukin-10 receptor subunit beta-like n=1 Tax=Labrus mixtus TaxID=508554 RepID=UPI0029BFD3DF|nr:interleukin-10 receptor subunit beta-like [Labrus mixtus]
MKMCTAVCAFILLFYSLSGSAVSGLVSRPSRVRLTSFNMDLVLRWDPPAGAEGDLRYTAQHRGVYTHRELEWIAVCVNVSRCECDLSHLHSAFGTYEGRVRTQRGEESSEWVVSDILTLDKDTIIGSPAVSLLSHGQYIEVSVTDPEFSNSTLRTVYSSPTYNITYWRDGHKDQAKSIANIQQNPVVLDELDPRTKYCVQVQIHTEINLNPSQSSRTVCESTTNREEAPWAAAVAIFVVMAIAMALVVLTVVYRKRISHFLCPKVSLPQDFVHLLAPLNSNMYRAMRDSKTPEEVCHPVCVIEHDRSEAEEGPLQADKPEEEERPLQADKPEEDGRPLQADRTEEGPLNADRNEERPLKADRNEERPLKADRNEERPLQADRTEDHPLKADRTEERPLQADRTEDHPLKADRNEERPLQADRTEDHPLKADRNEERPLQADRTELEEDP